MTRRTFALAFVALCHRATRAAVPGPGAGQPFGRGSGPGPVRIGVLGLFHPRELTFRSPEDGGLIVRTDAGTCVLNREESAHLSVAAGAVRVACAGRVLSATTVGVANRTGAAADLDIRVPGRIGRTFRGQLHVTQEAGALVPVIAMDLETAVASVVAAEQLEGTALEALKAQAVAARSYFVAGRGRHRGFDFCDTTHCQFLREPPPSGHAASRAARETLGLVLAFRGTPIVALYSASCGGRTRSMVEAGFPAGSGYPFFGVDCPYCQRHAVEWESRLALDADTDRLQAAPSERARLAVARRNGWSAVPGNNFEATREPDAIVLRGRGAGHGVGLCQAGASAMASETGSTFANILEHYYPGTTLMNGTQTG
jgi:stage II sporulation protein D